LHAPPHSVNPETQTAPQTFATHAGVPSVTGGQRTPHVPQLFTSVAVSTHAVAQ